MIWALRAWALQVQGCRRWDKPAEKVRQAPETQRTFTEKSREYRTYFLSTKDISEPEPYSLNG